MRRYAGGTGRAAQGMITLQFDYNQHKEMGQLCWTLEGKADGIMLQESNSVSPAQDGLSSLLSSFSVSISLA